MFWVSFVVINGLIHAFASQKTALLHFLIHKSLHGFMLSVVFVLSADEMASRLSCVTKNFLLDIWYEGFYHFFCISGMLIGNNDLYHFIPYSVTLMLAGDHKVGGKQNLLASFSCTLFNWSGWNLMWCWSNSSWASDFISEWCLLVKGNNCFFSDCVRKNVGMHLDIYEPIWFKAGMMILSTTGLDILILV